MQEKQQSINCFGLSLYSSGPALKPGATSEGSLMGCFYLDTDIAPLFPYINSLAEHAELFQNPKLIRFKISDHFIVLYSRYGIITPINSPDEANDLLDRLTAFLNDIYSRKDNITPNYKLFQKVSILEILKLLPKTNCRECGFPTCTAFAAMLSRNETVPGKCPHIVPPIAEQAVYPLYDNKGNVLSTVTINVDSNAGAHLQPDDPKYIDPVKSAKNKQSANESLPIPLTGREQEVLRLMAHGATNKEISHILKISPHTVKSHVIHIFNKLGVNDRTQAAVWATRHEII